MAVKTQAEIEEQLAQAAQKAQAVNTAAKAAALNASIDLGIGQVRVPTTVEQTPSFDIQTKR